MTGDPQVQHRPITRYPRRRWGRFWAAVTVLLAGGAGLLAWHPWAAGGDPAACERQLRDQTAALVGGALAGAEQPGQTGIPPGCRGLSDAQLARITEKIWSTP